MSAPILTLSGGSLRRDRPNGTTTPGSISQTQYIWSGADGRIIARDTIGSKFVYALTDAQGNVTSLVDYGTMSGQTGGPTWQVYERYSYNADGVPNAYGVNWNYEAPSLSGAIGTYGWNILYHEQTYTGITAAYGIYSSSIGLIQSPRGITRQIRLPMW